MTIRGCRSSLAVSSTIDPINIEVETPTRTLSIVTRKEAGDKIVRKYLHSALLSHDFDMIFDAAANEVTVALTSQ